jgi:glycosyltransferase involved in cell wall biosynthesis
MISIVVCARKKDISEELRSNILNTIGCEYELIVIDNSQNQYSIYSAYNHGIEQSRGDIICFLHDDVLWHTPQWGDFVQRFFNGKPQAGLLGIAGTRLKTRIPSAWWHAPRHLLAMQLIQHLPHNETRLENTGFEREAEVEVVAIDGVCMFMRRSCGLKMKTAATGFHCYDLYLSLACRARGFRIYVTKNLLLEHFSKGTLNNSWIDTTLKLHQEFRDVLPQAVAEADDPELIKEVEFQNGVIMIEIMLANRTKFSSIMKIWSRLFIIKPLGKAHLSIFRRVVLYCFTRN